MRFHGIFMWRSKDWSEGCWSSLKPPRRTKSTFRKLEGPEGPKSTNLLRTIFRFAAWCQWFVFLEKHLRPLCNSSCHLEAPKIFSSIRPPKIDYFESINRFFHTNTRTSSWLNLSFRRKALSLDCLIHPSESMPAFVIWFPSAPWYPEGLRRQRNAAAAALFPGKRTGEWSPPHGQVKKGYVEHMPAQFQWTSWILYT